MGFANLKPLRKGKLHLLGRLINLGPLLHLYIDSA